MNANIDSLSMGPIIEELPYETGKLLTASKDTKNYLEKKEKQRFVFTLEN